MVCFQANIVLMIVSDRNLLNLVQCKLVIGSIIELRSTKALMSRNLLGCLKRSLVFKVILPRQIGPHAMRTFSRTDNSGYDIACWNVRTNPLRAIR
jgi:hypothetical protein